MSARVVVVLFAMVSLIGTGPVAAQIDCSKIAPSIGAVPTELVDACWQGSDASDGGRAPTDIAIGPEMQSAMLIDVTLNAPEVLNPIAPFDTTDFTGACEFAGSDFSTLYCGDVANMFFAIDTTTGARTNIGTFNPLPPNGETISGLAWDEGSTRMFMVTTNVSTSSLMTVNISGATFFVGDIAGSGAMIAAAIDLAGDLWGYDILTDDLWSIDKATGAGTSIGPLGYDANFGQGMDFDDSDGTCYIFGFNNGLFQPELRTCDTSTGATTLVGVLGSTTPGALAQIPGAGIIATSFSPTMFAIDEVTDSLYGINPANGQTILIGPAGEDFSLSGLAWDSWSKTMYVSDVTLPGTAWGLGRINIYTGHVTIIGSHVTSMNIHGLAFDSNNNVLYGADHQNNCLTTINRDTGESSACIGLWIATNEIRGLGYNNHTDTLFGVDSTNLFTLDRATGEATLVGPHGINITSFPLGLEYDSATGVLYAAGMGDPLLYALNSATGAGSPVGAHGLGALGGLASFTAPGEPCGIFCDGFETGDTSAWD